MAASKLYPEVQKAFHELRDRKGYSARHSCLAKRDDLVVYLPNALYISTDH